MKEQEEYRPEKRLSQFSIEELKNVLGDFEKEFEAYNYGDFIRNDVVGFQKKGIIKWCIDEKIIRFQKENNYVYWFGIYPQYLDWMKKYEALKELKKRREYAIKLSTPTP